MLVVLLGHPSDGMWSIASWPNRNETKRSRNATGNFSYSSLLTVWRHL